MQLTHFDPKGLARMVDVGQKPDTMRVAVARGCVVMARETLALIVSQDEGGTSPITKGDVVGVARLAGIMAAKRASDLIPLCHPLPLTSVEVEIRPDDKLPGLLIEVTVRTTGKTGVEMEALTAVSVAGLTVYDMCKAVDRGMSMEDVRLVRKSGGVSGEFELDELEVTGCRGQRSR